MEGIVPEHKPKKKKNGGDLGMRLYLMHYSLSKESYLVTHHGNEVNKIIKIHETGFI